MTRLTKKIASSIEEEFNTSLFVYFGNRDNIEYYQAIRNKGGKCGFPLVFGIDSNNSIHWVEDYGTLNEIHSLNKEPELIDPT